MRKAVGFSPTLTTLVRFFQDAASIRVRLLIKCGFYTLLYGIIESGGVKERERRDLRKPGSQNIVLGENAKSVFLFSSFPFDLSLAHNIVCMLLLFFSLPSHSHLCVPAKSLFLMTRRDGA